MLVCWCDRIEDMTVEHNWSAHYNAVSEASLTSFCAVNIHSLDCVCVVQIIHSVHHPPSQIKWVGKQKSSQKFPKSSHLLNCVTVTVIPSVFIGLLISRDLQRTSSQKIMLFFCLISLSGNKAGGRDISIVCSKVNRFLSIFVSVWSVY